MLINRGRIEPCRDAIAGVRNVYLFNFVPYRIDRIRGQYGVALTSYPETTVYKFETLADGNTYQEQSGEFYSFEQELSVVLKKQDVSTHKLAQKLTGCEVGCIVEDYNGLFRLMGLLNGCTVAQISVVMGGDKSNLYGYQVQITANERFKAPLFSDLAAVGFEIFELGFLITPTGQILTGNGAKLTPTN